MKKDPKRMPINKLIDNLHQQFIDASSQIYSNSIFANELLLRDEELVINSIGTHLKNVQENLKKIPYADQTEVQQGWICFLSKIVTNKKIEMKTIVVNFDQWMEWSINY